MCTYVCYVYMYNVVCCVYICVCMYGCGMYMCALHMYVFIMFICVRICACEHVYGFCAHECVSEYVCINCTQL